MPGSGAAENRGEKKKKKIRGVSSQMNVKKYRDPTLRFKVVNFDFLHSMQQSAFESGTQAGAIPFSFFYYYHFPKILDQFSVISRQKKKEKNLRFTSLDVFIGSL
jgi:hypothetical protein